MRTSQRGCDARDERGDQRHADRDGDTARRHDQAGGRRGIAEHVFQEQRLQRDGAEHPDAEGHDHERGRGEVAILQQVDLAGSHSGSGSS